MRLIRDTRPFWQSNRIPEDSKKGNDRNSNVMSCPTNEHYKYLENLIHYLVNM